MNYRRSVWTLGLALLLLGARGVADTIYVNGETGNDDWDGRCAEWDGGTCGPKATIQAGIDASVDGDQVVLADGAYTGVGNKDLKFEGRSIALHSASGDPALCVIDCEGDGGGFHFVNGESELATVSGITVSNSYGGELGVAVEIRDFSSPAFYDCVFSANVGDHYGAAVAALDHCDPVFVRCDFVQNRANDGGAVSFGIFSDPKFVECRFIANTARRGGGAVALLGPGTALFEDCTFCGNFANEGGVMSLGGADAIVLGCRFSNNAARKVGGVFWFTLDSGPYVINSIVTNNDCVGSGGVAYATNGNAGFYSCTIVDNSASYGPFLTCSYRNNSAPSSVEIANCIIRNAGPEEVFIEDESIVTMYYTNICGGWPGPGNIDTVPMFVDAETGLQRSYRLAAGSPCIDAGGNDYVLPDYFDLDGDGDYDELTPIDFRGRPRVVDDPDTEDTGQGTPPIVDMGAYEYQGLRLARDRTGGT